MFYVVSLCGLETVVFCLFEFPCVAWGLLLFLWGLIAVSNSCKDGVLLAGSEMEFHQLFNEEVVNGVPISRLVDTFRFAGDFTGWSTRGRNTQLEQLKIGCEPGDGFFVRYCVDHFLIGTVVKEKGTRRCEDIKAGCIAVAQTLSHAPGANAFLMDLTHGRVLDFGPLRWLRARALDLASAELTDHDKAFAVISLDGSVSEIFRWDFKRVKKTEKSSAWGVLVRPIYQYVYHCEPVVSGLPVGER